MAETEVNERYLEASKLTDENGWFRFATFDMNECDRQEYTGNGCIFAAGHISEESAKPACDTMYLLLEKDGHDATIWMLRPDEMACIARIVSGALWSRLVDEVAD